MTSRRFLVEALTGILLLAAVFAGVNWRINFYGLYGNVAGQLRVVSANERWTKYLYTFNQIPANYDSLLAGSSLTANLETAKVRSLRLYNLSTSGSNIHEQVQLVSNAIRRGSFKLLVVTLYPYILKDHMDKGGELVAQDYWSGLGSVPLIEDYLVWGATHAHVFRGRFTASGAQNLDISGNQPIDADVAFRHELNTSRGDMRFGIDPVAADELRAMIAQARAAGLRIVVYLPPIYRPRFVRFQKAYADFYARTLPLFASQDAVLNLNDGTFDVFTADPKNFFDGVHYNQKGAELVSEEFARRLQALLQVPVHDSCSGAGSIVP